jgi:hypothetical protein
MLVAVMKDEAFYKAQAEEARKLAKQLHNLDLVQSWLQIAEAYETLAAAARSSQTLNDSFQILQAISPSKKELE